jgi:hypothetical protein
MTDEVKKTRRKLHNEELHNPYSSPNTVRVVKTKITWADRTLAMKHEGKRPLVRLRHRRKDLDEIGHTDADETMI